jgi:hypothetical protein
LGLRNAYKTLAGNSKINMPLGWSWHGRDDNIKMDLKTDKKWGYAQESTGLESGPIVSSYERDKETSNSVTMKEFLHYLRDFTVSRSPCLRTYSDEVHIWSWFRARGMNTYNFSTFIYFRFI